MVLIIFIALPILQINPLFGIHWNLDLGNFYLLWERDGHLNLNDSKPFFQPSPLSALAWTRLKGLESMKGVMSLYHGSLLRLLPHWSLLLWASGFWISCTKALQPIELQQNSRELGQWGGMSIAAVGGSPHIWGRGDFSSNLTLLQHTFLKQSDCLQCCFKHLVLLNAFIQGRDTLVLTS